MTRAVTTACGDSVQKQTRKRSWSCPLALVAIIAMAAVGGARVSAQQHSLGAAEVIVATGASVPEQTAARMLAEEVNRRTGLRWAVGSEDSRAPVRIVLARIDQMDQLDGIVAAPVSAAERPRTIPEKPESFAIRGTATAARTTIVVEGRDDRGVLFGAGYLLRHLAMTRGSIEPVGGLAALDTSQAPAYAVRGQQLGYRPKNNTFDGWSPAQFEQYIRNLAVFGTNTIELIPPRSDDEASSPLFTLPPLAMMQTLSATIARYGLDCSIWYPAMDKGYANPATVEKAVAEWGAVFRALPRVDAVFVPGGDPGNTEPKYLFALLEREAAELRRSHPGAQMWVSPQSFNAQWLAEFYALLTQHPKWLTGVVYGPEMRETPEQFRAHVPREYPIRFYPDITHTLAAQYPVPQWDPAFAMTEGREPIDPRPVDEGILFRRYAPLTTGFVAYSEGANDDINKVLWSAWAWNPQQSAGQVLVEYGRYFIAPEIADTFARGVAGLEQNWRGPLAANASIAKTLTLFKQMEQQEPAAARENWRLQQVLYRAYYDGYLQQRKREEAGAENRAVQALRAASVTNTEQALLAAKAALGSATQCSASTLCARAASLAGNLFRTVRMQLSVGRYGALATDRGANLDRIDEPLNDRAWLLEQIARAQAEPTAALQLKSIESTLAELFPTGGLVDDLGASDLHPHLVRGSDFAQDPSGLSGVYTSIATSPSDKPLFARGFAGTLYDQPLEMRYTGLQRGASYHVHVVYPANGSAYRVLANGVAVAQVCAAPAACSEAEIALPAAATASGSLTLSWSVAGGQGGNGRRMQVSRVVLARVP